MNGQVMKDLPAVASRPAAVLVDVDRMGEALHNLLDNAIRHTAPGGDVTAKAGVDGGWVELVVVDDGEGSSRTPRRRASGRAAATT